MNVDFSTIDAAADEAQVDISIGYVGRGGRGGEGTLAITCDGLPYLIEFVVQMMLADSDSYEWISNVNTDAMGHGIVAYWPQVTVDGAPDEDDEEGDA